MAVRRVTPGGTHTVLLITYERACTSGDFTFRENMMKVIDKLYNPIRTRWPGIQWWRVVPAYNMIDARFLDELEINIKRIRLLERLKVIRLYVFRGVEPETFITQNGVQVQQNRWVYDRVLTVIPADRILVLRKDMEGLPTVPKDYRLLNTRENPPSYSSFGQTGNSLKGRLLYKRS